MSADTRFTYNPLTKANTPVRATETVEIGSRIAFNPGKRGWPLLITGEVKLMTPHRRYGRIATVLVDEGLGFYPGARVTVPVDQLTCKILPAKEVS